MKGISRSPRIARRIALAGVSALAIAILAACSGGHAQEAAAPPAPEVSAAPVLARQVSQWDEFSGRIEAVQSVELRPRVSGYIDQVNYVEGQEVKKGDVLFTIDARSYQAEFDRARAELARARTQAALAHSESERARRLAEQQAIAAETAEQRRASAEQAAAQVQA
ncbi:MAG: efflux RND transporter periplasmic adaptor subunit, partial [Stenotrophomonas sp.]